MMVKAPWTPEQVEILNRFQKLDFVHPFTCGSGDRTDERHLDNEGVLVATVDGWICPYCTFTQAWAHDFMMDPKTIEASLALNRELNESAAAPYLGKRNE